VAGRGGRWPAVSRSLLGKSSESQQMLTDGLIKNEAKRKDKEDEAPSIYDGKKIAHDSVFREKAKYEIDHASIMTF
jgi:hypothetical protein